MIIILIVNNSGLSYDYFVFFNRLNDKSIPHEILTNTQEVSYQDSFI